MRRIAVPLAVFAFALALASPARASDLPSGGLTRQDVVSWLGKHGYQASIRHDNTANDDFVGAVVKGINFGVWFYSCDNGGRCKDLQYSAGWSGTKIPLDKVNEWNRDKRYLRAYFARAGGLFAEYDIDISPGGTWEQLDHSLDRWVDQIGDFKTYMGL
jgi:putative sensory transduction regulator